MAEYQTYQQSRQTLSNLVVSEDTSVPQNIIGGLLKPQIIPVTRVDTQLLPTSITEDVKSLHTYVVESGVDKTQSYFVHIDQSEDLLDSGNNNNNNQYYVYNFHDYAPNTQNQQQFGKNNNNNALNKNNNKSPPPSTNVPLTHLQPVLLQHLLNIMHTITPASNKLSYFTQQSQKIQNNNNTNNNHNPNIDLQSLLLHPKQVDRLLQNLTHYYTAVFESAVEDSTLSSTTTTTTTPLSPNALSPTNSNNNNVTTPHPVQSPREMRIQQHKQRAAQRDVDFSMLLEQLGAFLPKYVIVILEPILTAWRYRVLCMTLNEKQLSEDDSDEEDNIDIESDGDKEETEKEQKNSQTTIPEQSDTTTTTEDNNDDSSNNADIIVSDEIKEEEEKETKKDLEQKRLLKIQAKEQQKLEKHQAKQLAKYQRFNPFFHCNIVELYSTLYRDLLRLEWWFLVIIDTIIPQQNKAQKYIENHTTYQTPSPNPSNKSLSPSERFDFTVLGTHIQRSAGMRFEPVINQDLKTLYGEEEALNIMLQQQKQRQTNNNLPRNRLNMNNLSNMYEFKEFSNDNKEHLNMLLSYLNQYQTTLCYRYAFLFSLLPHYNMFTQLKDIDTIALLPPPPSSSSTSLTSSQNNNNNNATSQIAFKNAHDYLKYIEQRHISTISTTTQILLNQFNARFTTLTPFTRHLSQYNTFKNIIQYNLHYDMVERHKIKQKLQILQNVNIIQTKINSFIKNLLFINSNYMDLQYLMQTYPPGSVTTPVHRVLGELLGVINANQQQQEEKEQEKQDFDLYTGMDMTYDTVRNNNGSSNNNNNSSQSNTSSITSNTSVDLSAIISSIPAPTFCHTPHNIPQFQSWEDEHAMSYLLHEDRISLHESKMAETLYKSYYIDILRPLIEQLMLITARPVVSGGDNNNNDDSSNISVNNDNHQNDKDTQQEDNDNDNTEEQYNNEDDITDDTINADLEEIDNNEQKKQKQQKKKKYKYKPSILDELYNQCYDSGLFFYRKHTPQQPLRHPQQQEHEGEQKQEKPDEYHIIINFPYIAAQYKYNLKLLGDFIHIHTAPLHHPQNMLIQPLLLPEFYQDRGINGYCHSYRCNGFPGPHTGMVVAPKDLEGNKNKQQEQEQEQKQQQQQQQQKRNVWRPLSLQQHAQLFQQQQQRQTVFWYQDNTLNIADLLGNIVNSESNGSPNFSNNTHPFSSAMQRQLQQQQQQAKKDFDIQYKFDMRLRAVRYYEVDSMMTRTYYHDLNPMLVHNPIHKQIDELYYLHTPFWYDIFKDSQDVYYAGNPNTYIDPDFRTTSSSSSSSKFSKSKDNKKQQEQERNPYNVLLPTARAKTVGHIAPNGADVNTTILNDKDNSSAKKSKKNQASKKLKKVLKGNHPPNNKQSKSKKTTHKFSNFPTVSYTNFTLDVPSKYLDIFEATTSRHGAAMTSWETSHRGVEFTNPAQLNQLTAPHAGEQASTNKYERHHPVVIRKNNYITIKHILEGFKNKITITKAELKNNIQIQQQNKQNTQPINNNPTTLTFQQTIANLTNNTTPNEENYQYTRYEGYTDDLLYFNDDLDLNGSNNNSPKNHFMSQFEMDMLSSSPLRQQANYSSLTQRHAEITTVVQAYEDMLIQSSKYQRALQDEIQRQLHQAVRTQIGQAKPRRVGGNTRTFGLFGPASLRSGGATSAGSTKKKTSSSSSNNNSMHKQQRNWHPALNEEQRDILAKSDSLMTFRSLCNRLNDIKKTTKQMARQFFVTYHPEQYYTKLLHECRTYQLLGYDIGRVYGGLGIDYYDSINNNINDASLYNNDINTNNNTTTESSNYNTPTLPSQFDNCWDAIDASTTLALSYIPDLNQPNQQKPTHVDNGPDIVRLDDIIPAYDGYYSLKLPFKKILDKMLEGKMSTLLSSPSSFLSGKNPFDDDVELSPFSSAKAPFSGPFDFVQDPSIITTKTKSPKAEQQQQQKQQQQLGSKWRSRLDTYNSNIILTPPSLKKMQMILTNVYTTASSSTSSNNTKKKKVSKKKSGEDKKIITLQRIKPSVNDPSNTVGCTPADIRNTSSQVNDVFGFLYRFDEFVSNSANIDENDNPIVPGVSSARSLKWLNANGYVNDTTIPMLLPYRDIFAELLKKFKAHQKVIFASQNNKNNQKTKKIERNENSTEDISDDSDVDIDNIDEDMLWSDNGMTLDDKCELFNFEQLMEILQYTRHILYYFQCFIVTSMQLPQIALKYGNVIANDVLHIDMRGGVDGNNKENELEDEQIFSNSNTTNNDDDHKNEDIHNNINTTQTKQNKPRVMDMDMIARLIVKYCNDPINKHQHTTTNPSVKQLEHYQQTKYPADVNNSNGNNNNMKQMNNNKDKTQLIPTWASHCYTEYNELLQLYKAFDYYYQSVMTPIYQLLPPSSSSSSSSNQENENENNNNNNVIVNVDDLESFYRLKYDPSNHSLYIEIITTLYNNENQKQQKIKNYFEFIKIGTFNPNNGYIALLANPEDTLAIQGIIAYLCQCHFIVDKVVINNLLQQLKPPTTTTSTDTNTDSNNNNTDNDNTPTQQTLSFLSLHNVITHINPYFRFVKWIESSFVLFLTKLQEKQQNQYKLLPKSYNELAKCMGFDLPTQQIAETPSNNNKKNDNTVANKSDRNIISASATNTTITSPTATSTPNNALSSLSFDPTPKSPTTPSVTTALTSPTSTNHSLLSPSTTSTTINSSLLDTLISSTSQNEDEDEDDDEDDEDRPPTPEELARSARRQAKREAYLEKQQMYRKKIHEIVDLVQIIHNSRRTYVLAGKLPTAEFIAKHPVIQTPQTIIKMVYETLKTPEDLLLLQYYYNVIHPGEMLSFYADYDSGDDTDDNNNNNNTGNSENNGSIGSNNNRSTTGGDDLSSILANPQKWLADMAKQDQQQGLIYQPQNRNKLQNSKSNNNDDADEFEVNEDEEDEEILQYIIKPTLNSIVVTTRDIVSMHNTTRLEPGAGANANNNNNNNNNKEHKKNKSKNDNDGNTNNSNPLLDSNSFHVAIYKKMYTINPNTNKKIYSTEDSIIPMQRKVNVIRLLTFMFGHFVDEITKSMFKQVSEDYLIYAPSPAWHSLKRNTTKFPFMTPQAYSADPYQSLKDGIEPIIAHPQLQAHAGILAFNNGFWVRLAKFFFCQGGCRFCCCCRLFGQSNQKNVIGQILKEKGKPQLLYLLPDTVAQGYDGLSVNNMNNDMITTRTDNKNFMNNDSDNNNSTNNSIVDGQNNNNNTATAGNENNQSQYEYNDGNMFGSLRKNSSTNNTNDDTTKHGGKLSWLFPQNTPEERKSYATRFTSAVIHGGAEPNNNDHVLRLSVTSEMQWGERHDDINKRISTDNPQLGLVLPPRGTFGEPQVDINAKQNKWSLAVIVGNNNNNNNNENNNNNNNNAAVVNGIDPAKIVTSLQQSLFSPKQIEVTPTVTPVSSPTTLTTTTTTTNKPSQQQQQQRYPKSYKELNSNHDVEIYTNHYLQYYTQLMLISVLALHLQNFRQGDVVRRIPPRQARWRFTSLVIAIFTWLLIESRNFIGLIKSYWLIASSILAVVSGLEWTAHALLDMWWIGELEKQEIQTVVNNYHGVVYEYNKMYIDVLYHLTMLQYKAYDKVVDVTPSSSSSMMIMDKSKQQQQQQLQQINNNNNNVVDIDDDVVLTTTTTTKPTTILQEQKPKNMLNNKILPFQKQPYNSMKNTSLHLRNDAKTVKRNKIYDLLDQQRVVNILLTCGFDFDFTQEPKIKATRQKKYIIKKKNNINSLVPDNNIINDNDEDIDIKTIENKNDIDIITPLDIIPQQLPPSRSHIISLTMPQANNFNNNNNNNNQGIINNAAGDGVAPVAAAVAAQGGDAAAIAIEPEPLHAYNMSIIFLIWFSIKTYILSYNPDFNVDLYRLAAPPQPVVAVVAPEPQVEPEQVAAVGAHDVVVGEVEEQVQQQEINDDDDVEQQQEEEQANDENVDMMLEEQQNDIHNDDGNNDVVPDYGEDIFGVIDDNEQTNNLHQQQNQQTSYYEYNTVNNNDNNTPNEEDDEDVELPYNYYQTMNTTTTTTTTTAATPDNHNNEDFDLVEQQQPLHDITFESRLPQDPSTEHTEDEANKEE